jgi:Sulfatase
MAFFGYNHGQRITMPLKKRPLILHPFLFSAYTILGVYSRNAVEIPIAWILRPLVIILIVMALLVWALTRLTKNRERAGLIASLGVFWFVFGHLYHVLQGTPKFNDLPANIFLALLAWTAPLLLLGSHWAWKRIGRTGLLTTFLNATSIFVLILPTFTTLRYGIQSITYERDAFQNVRTETQALTSTVNPPDIYWIILDAYGRSDYLEYAYGYDNQEFLNFLHETGFYVAEQSRPNYPQTELSLASTINMDYLDAFAVKLQNTDNRNPLTDILQHSTLRDTLERMGYQFVALPSAAMFAQFRDADTYLSMNRSDINEFEGLLLSTTLLALPIEKFNLSIPVPSYSLHRQTIAYELETLKSIPAETPGPKFVFAHILAPHPPFVFDADGNPIQADRPYNMGDAGGFQGTDEEYAQGYVDAVQYLNREMEKIITTILKNSSAPPIIIIQGDHGPGDHYNTLALDTSCLWERYSILSAYYFPDQNYAALYPEITPVNSFRVVLNEYFGANLSLLEDRSYYAAWFKPYQFTDVTEQIMPVCDMP